MRTVDLGRKQLSLCDSSIATIYLLKYCFLYDQNYAFSVYCNILSDILVYNAIFQHYISPFYQCTFQLSKTGCVHFMDRLPPFMVLTTIMRPYFIFTEESVAPYRFPGAFFSVYYKVAGTRILSRVSQSSLQQSAYTPIHVEKQ